MSRYIKFISLVFTAFVLVCCTKGVVDGVVNEDEIVDYGFYFSGTKGGGPTDMPTYRAMLLRAADKVYTDTSGTYRDLAMYPSETKAWLIPCLVNSTTGLAVNGNEDHSAGLRAKRGTYFITFVSPAVAPQTYTYKGQSEKGFHLNREIPTTSRDLSFTSPIKINSLVGNHLNGQAVFDFSHSDTLRSLKSQVRLIIKCASGSGTSVTVDSAGFTNLYSECYYNIRLDSLENFTTSSALQTVAINVTTPAVLTPGSAGVNTQYLSLFSLDYSKKASGAYVYTVPNVVVTLSDTTVTVPMPHDLKPMTRYDCTIEFNKSSSAPATLSLTCTIADWENSNNKHNGGSAAHLE